MNIRNLKAMKNNSGDNLKESDSSERRAHDSLVYK